MWSSPLCNSATSLKTDGFGGEKNEKKTLKLKIENCSQTIIFSLI